MVELSYVCRTGLLDQGIRQGGGPAEEPIPDWGTAGATSRHVVTLRVTRGTCVLAQGTRVEVVQLSVTLNIIQTVRFVHKLPPMSLLNHLINILTK